MSEYVLIGVFTMSFFAAAWLISRRRMDDTKKLVLLCILLLPLVGLRIWWDVSVYKECHTHDAWWYCLRIIGK